MWGENKIEFRYIDTFAGVGGFRLGIERAFDNRGLLQIENTKSNKYFTTFKGGQEWFESCHCVATIEWDKYCCQIYSKNFGETVNPTDITKVNPSELPDFDLLCGGFPCQSFSIAGKRRGFEDTRGTMFFEIARIVKVKRPKYLLLENVKGLLNHEQGKTFSIIIQTLEELGYNVQWMVLNSKFFGVPQNRERVFIIGNLRGESRSEVLPFGYSCQEADAVNSEARQEIIGTLETDGWERRHEHNRRVWDADGNAPTIPTSTGGGHMTKIGIIDDVARINKYKLGDRMKDDGDCFTLNSIEQRGIAMDLYNHTESSEVCPTLKDPIHNDRRIREGMRIRKLTPTECERLQGFPDGWTQGFSDTQRYKMMGNAVTVNVIEAIIGKLIEGGE